jgi:trehalose synthase
MNRMVNDVAVPPRSVVHLQRVIGEARFVNLLSAAGTFRAAIAGRTVWNINSTAVGGGVAEMLQCLVGYVNDLGIPIRWAVIGGDPAFFAITKRLHNLIHGSPGDGGPLGTAEAALYAEVAAANAAELLGRIRPGDLVLLHDPQTAGLAEALSAAGTHVVWRCHIGADRQNGHTRTAWNFLRPFLEPVRAFVFSRREYVPPGIPEALSWIIPPSIDPFSPKNQDLDAATVHAILTTIGVLDAPFPRQPGRFTRLDATAGVVTDTAEVVGDGRPAPDEPVVVQVSRWDRLKDMAGVLHGFADHTAPYGPGHLMLVGPSVSGVSDDPEGAAVYAECVDQWKDLPAPVRSRVQLVTLPLHDIDENAAMVNAIQRHAAVICQKSLAEGFGLTVAEGMWKGRPVVGSAVGGIRDQLAPGTGIALPDPGDLAAFGAAVRGLLDHPYDATRMGAAAHAHVRANYVGDLHLLRYAELLGTLLTA